MKTALVRCYLAAAADQSINISRARATTNHFATKARHSQLIIGCSIVPEKIFFQKTTQKQPIPFFPGRDKN
jgi:hypothetical protein